jgi:hypothetical protein
MLISINRNLKIFATLLPILVTGIFVAPGRAGKVEPTPVPCWFFLGDSLELKQTCIYESVFWMGGGGNTLRWEDGVQTNMTWGMQGRGGIPCVGISVDGVCGVTYYRHSTTLKRISKEEKQKPGMKDQSLMTCVQLRNKSICWDR